MAAYPFVIVDVFAEEKYAGNQLAVFTAAADMPGELMQLIARETHYSETTFILSDQPRDGGWDVRIFTPGEEVPFAGHPTLGTAWVIREHLAGGTAGGPAGESAGESGAMPAGEVVLNLAVGQIPVRFDVSDDERPILWMRQNRPDFGDVLAPEVIAPVLGLDLWDIDERFPIQDVSTGLPFIIVPLTNLAALQRSAVKRDAFFDLIADTRAKAPLLFCPQGRSAEDDLSVRVFVDYYNIPEDPATGSGNGCLAAWLVEHRYFSSDAIDLRVGQGHEIDRPSRLYLRARQTDDGIEVEVGGRVIETARGEFV